MVSFFLFLFFVISLVQYPWVSAQYNCDLSIESIASLSVDFGDGVNQIDFDPAVPRRLYTVQLPYNINSVNVNATPSETAGRSDSGACQVYITVPMDWLNYKSGGIVIPGFTSDITGNSIDYTTWNWPAAFPVVVDFTNMGDAGFSMYVGISPKYSNTRATSPYKLYVHFTRGPRPQTTTPSPTTVSGPVSDDPAYISIEKFKLTAASILNEDYLVIFDYSVDRNSNMYTVRVPSWTEHIFVEHQTSDKVYYSVAISGLVDGLGGATYIQALQGYGLGVYPWSAFDKNSLLAVYVIRNSDHDSIAMKFEIMWSFD